MKTQSPCHQGSPFGHTGEVRERVAMAVEAQHLNFFYNNTNPYDGVYGLPLLSGTTTDSFLPVYNNSSIVDTFQAKAAVKTESDLPYSQQFLDSRKRPREEMVNPMMPCQVQNGNRSGPYTFLGEDVSVQMQQQQQQFEMDRLIAQHNDDVRRELEERRKRYSRRVIAAVEDGIIKRLKAKDDEIERMMKLNWALQEKVKSLAVEGQIWQDLAHTNEATVQTLRSNLEQVLSAQLNNNQERGDDFIAVADDAQSCCGSNYKEEEGEECGTRGGDRMCKHCGKEESSVLLLPCRHLCLCTVCGSSVYTCPVCNASKNASVHVINV